MKQWKKFVAGLTAATMMCGMLAGCSGNTDTTPADTGAADDGAAVDTGSSDKPVIGVILNHTQDIFMKNMERGVKQAAEANPDYEIKLVESGQDPAKQLSQVEQFISEKVDIIVLNPTNQESSASAIDAAVEAGIPIMTVNTTSTEEAQAKCLTYVGSDAVESGRIQARYVAELLGGKGRVAYMDAIIGHQAQIDRRAGWDEIMADYPDIEIVLDGAGNFVQADAMELTENWLQSGQEFDIVVCQGVDMACGAVLALEDVGLAGKIPVSGIDVSEDGVTYLESGAICNLVFQDAIGQGEQGVATAIKILNGESVDSYIDIPYELVTTENVGDYAGRY